MQATTHSVLAARARLRRVWDDTVGLLRRWDARAFERCYLASLSDPELRDMRLTRWQAREEASKPFWKA